MNLQEALPKAQRCSWIIGGLLIAAGVALLGGVYARWWKQFTDIHESGINFAWIGFAVIAVGAFFLFFALLCTIAQGAYQSYLNNRTPQ